MFVWRHLRQQEQDGHRHGHLPGGVHELVVVLVLQDQEAEQPGSQDPQSGEEEAAGVLHAGVAVAVRRAVGDLGNKTEVQCESRAFPNRSRKLKEKCVL